MQLLPSGLRPDKLPAFPLLAALAFLAGCSTAQVRMPPGFAAHAVAYEVSGHSPRRFNQPVRFGPYSALELREGSTFSWGFPVGAIDVGRTSKPVAFTMLARDLPPVEVQCRSRAWTAGAGRETRRAAVDLTALAGPFMACALRADGAPALPLEVARNGGRMTGRLAVPWGGDYAIRSLSGYGGSAWVGGGATGYEIGDAGGPVAVVDVLNGGRVHLDSRLEAGQGLYLAAASAALLLLDPELGD